MSDFKFTHIGELSNLDLLKNGFYLWIWYADKIPPHIGCSLNGFYYSLKVNGKDDGLLVEKVLNIVEKKKILTLFVPIDKIVNSAEIKAVFAHYKQARSGTSTCLTPIVNLLGLEVLKIRQLSDLLKYLESENILGKVFGLNLTEGYQGIPSYGADDIQNRLRNLENVQVKTDPSSLSRTV
jgi:hypothetical protein